MDTNDLIGKLAGDLKPVRRLSPAWARAGALALLSLALVFGFIFAFTQGLRADWAALFGPHLCQSSAIFMAGLLSAWAAAALAVPDAKIRPHIYAMLGLATGLWLLVMTGELLKGPISLTSFGERNCLTDLALLLVVPFAAAVFMATRGAPVWRGWTGYAAMLSAGSFAAVGMRFLCAKEDPAHLLVWHFLPVPVFALFGIMLGQILLKWKSAKV